MLLIPETMFLSQIKYKLKPLWNAPLGNVNMDSSLWKFMAAQTATLILLERNGFYVSSCP